MLTLWVIVTFLGIPLFVWAHFADPQMEHTITVIYFGAVGMCILLTLVKWYRTRPTNPKPEPPEPPEPAEEWVQKVHRIPGTGRHWEPGQDEG